MISGTKKKRKELRSPEKRTSKTALEAPKKKKEKEGQRMTAAEDKERPTLSQRNADPQARIESIRARIVGPCRKGWGSMSRKRVSFGNGSLRTAYKIHKTGGGDQKLTFGDGQGLHRGPPVMGGEGRRGGKVQDRVRESHRLLAGKIIGHQEREERTGSSK